MHLEPGSFTEGALRVLDQSRAYHAARKASEAEKRGRKRRRRVRKGLQDEELEAEGVQYEAGQF